MPEQVDQSTEAGASTPAADPIKNLKAEMDRKLGNLETTSSQLLAMMQKMQTPAPKHVAPLSSPKFGDLIFDKPEEAAQLIKNQARDEIKAELAEQNKVYTRQQSTIQKLANDYPELTSNDHELTVKAVEYYNALPADEQSHPLAYQSAVKEAAIELGLKPARLRKKDSDDFVMGGDGQRVSRGQAKQEDAYLGQLSEAFGIKLDDKVKERIKSKHGRRSYTNWE